MRVRIRRPFYWKAQNRTMKVDDVVNVPDEDAQLWLRHGMASQDKSVDVPEHKAPVEAKPAESVKVIKRKARKAKK